MKRIQLYTTASFLLMTLSAAAETWFAGVVDHRSLFLPSLDLLKILTPTAMIRLEAAGLENFPVFWGLLTSTVFKLPLWLIFAITSAGFSYLLMIDPKEIRRHGKDFENLEMWASCALENEKIDKRGKGMITKKSAWRGSNYAHVKPEIWSPTSSSEDKNIRAHEAPILSEYEIYELTSSDLEFFSEHENNDVKRVFTGSKGSALVDPEIWLPVSPPQGDSTGIGPNDVIDKDEIYEFDEFCEFLDYTDSQFDSQQQDAVHSSVFIKNEKA